MSRLTGILVATVLAGAAISAQAAEKLAVEEVVSLKALGYSDAQIKAEIVRTKSTFSLSPSDVGRLKEAGCGEELIALMSGAGAKRKLTVDDVVTMVRAGKSGEAVLYAIVESGATFRISITQAVDLARKKVPLVVILAMKGKPIQLADVQRLGATGPDAKTWYMLAFLVGVEKTALPPSEALQLARSGVPREALFMLRHGFRPRSTVKDSPGDVAKAILAAYKARNTPELIQYSKPEGRRMLWELTEDLVAGRRVDRELHELVFGGWRWQAVEAWNGKVARVVQSPDGKALVEFGPGPTRAEVAAVQLIRREGQWLYDDIQSVKAERFRGAPVRHTEASAETSRPGAGSPQAVAQAVLKAWKAKDLNSMAALGTAFNKEMLGELAAQGQSHPRYRSIFVGHRWQAIQAWDGTVGEVRYRRTPRQTEAWVEFMKLPDTQARMVVTLIREGGRWCFEDVHSRGPEQWGRGLKSLDATP